jgi:SAM-dependent methyltransferase
MAAEGLARNLRMREQSKNAQVIGIDLQTDRGVIQQECGYEELSAQLVDCDALSLPIADSTVDFVYSMAGLAYIPDALSAIGEVHRVLKMQSSAFFYLMKGGRDVCANIELDELLSSVKGFKFKTHNFSPNWYRHWQQNPRKAPFYLDGVILEIVKTDHIFDSPYQLSEQCPLFDNPIRSFEKHGIAGIYAKRT